MTLRNRRKTSAGSLRWNSRRAQDLVSPATANSASLPKNEDLAPIDKQQLPPGAQQDTVDELSAERHIDSPLLSLVLEKATSGSAMTELRNRSDKMASVYTAIHTNESLNTWRRGLKDAVEILVAAGYGQNGEHGQQLENSCEKHTQTRDAQTQKKNQITNVSPIELPAGQIGDSNSVSLLSCSNTSAKFNTPPEFTFSVADNTWEEHSTQKRRTQPVDDAPRRSSSEPSAYSSQNRTSWWRNPQSPDQNTFKLKRLATMHPGNQGLDIRSPPVCRAKPRSPPVHLPLASTNLKAKAAPQTQCPEKRWKWLNILTPRGVCGKAQAETREHQSAQSGSSSSSSSSSSSFATYRAPIEPSLAAERKLALSTNSRSGMPTSRTVMSQRASRLSDDGTDAELSQLVERIVEVCSTAESNASPHQKDLLLSFAANRVLADKWIRWDRQHREHHGC